MGPIRLKILFAVLLLLTAGVFAVALLFGWINWHGVPSVDSVRSAIRGMGPWGIAASISLMIVHSFVPFPAEVIAVANGMSYGPVWGVVVTWVGAMLGAFLAFGLTRLFGRALLVHLVREGDLRRVDGWVEKNGTSAFFLARLIPVISFNLVNYAAGLTQLRVWTFFWTTALGILPLTVLMVTIGDRVEVIKWPFWLGAGIISVVVWVLCHRWRR